MNDFDFGQSDTGEGPRLVVTTRENRTSWAVHGLQLLPRLKDGVTDTDINQECEANDYPDWRIVAIDTDGGPRVTDPAPELKCVSRSSTSRQCLIHLPWRFRILSHLQGLGLIDRPVPGQRALHSIRYNTPRIVSSEMPHRNRV